MKQFRPIGKSSFPTLSKLMNRGGWRLLWVIIIVLVVAVFSPFKATLVRAKDLSDNNLLKELKVFTDVLAIVQSDYVREVNSKEVVEGAIKGMLSTLDPHSGYLDPDFYSDLQVQTRGEFGGLGIEITIKDGLLVVVAPMEGSPAERAGVQAGDAIVKIDGKFTKDFSLIDAVKRLRGPKGTKITISVYRKNQPDLLNISLTREKIAVRSVKGRYLENGYGYIRISQFVEKTAEDLKTSLRKIHDKAPQGEVRGLILDLRNNPGGLLTQAIQVSDLFLSEGVIVYTDGRDKAQQQKFYARPRGTEPNYPIVAIVNQGSASAAEIVSGALKDHGRALIVGTQTFGKGSVQTITPLNNGGAVTLTTALYFTKSGNSIQVKGVKPDIDVPLEAPVSQEEALDDGNGSKKPKRGAGKRSPFFAREKDLPGAIGNPNQQPRGDEPDEADAEGDSTERLSIPSVNPEAEALDSWLLADNQFRKAYELLKSYDVFAG